MKICDLPEGYVPNEDEDFMNQYQREYFRQKLLVWERELLIEIAKCNEKYQDVNLTYTPDPNEKASYIADMALLQKNKSRAEKLVRKIHYSLKKIHDGTYGYCERTGEQISLKRLEIRPIANLCIKAQEAHEREISK